MVIILDQYTPQELFVKILTKSFNKQLEQKSRITRLIKTTKGGEQLAWIKKYNGLFIHPWGYKEKNKS
jgi:ATP-dependent Clp protease adapter protein ClpS